MFSVRLILLLFLYLKNALCVKQLCGDEDYECIQKSIESRVYRMIVAGIPGVVETSDPLSIETITADLPDLKYSLHKTAMTGLKDCNFVKLNITKVNAKEMDIHYIWSYPLLEIDAQYEVNGHLNKIPVEGKGTSKFKYADIYFTINGTREIVKDESGNSHINLKHYQITFELKGTADVHYENLEFKNENKITDNTRKLEEMSRDLVINAFMNNFMKNLKKYLKSVPTRDLHFKNV